MPTRIDIAALDRLAEQQGRAGSRRQQSRQHFHGRGLAATIGAEKPKDLAALNAEADVIDCRECPELLGEPFGFDCRSIAGGLPGRDDRFLVAASGLLGNQLDEGPFEGCLVGAARLSSSGVPVASTLPSFMAASQSKPSASSMYAVRYQYAHGRAPEADAGDEFPELPARQRVYSVVGSSRIRRSGSWISEQHSPSFCFIPQKVCRQAGRGRQ